MKNFGRLALGAMLLTAACGHNEAVFVTSTSIGLNADATQQGLSIAYERFDGFIGPTDENGHTPPVVGFIESNQSVLRPEVKQVYATGEAALDVTVPDAGLQARQDALLNDQNDTIQGERRVAFFAVEQTTGFKVRFNPTTIVESVQVGYNRTEASFLPLVADKDGVARYPSTLASVSRNIAIQTLTDSNDGISQFFATGDAARNLAVQDSIRGLIKSVAETNVQQKTSSDVDKAQAWIAANKTDACPDATSINFKPECAALKQQFQQLFSFE